MNQNITQDRSEITDKELHYVKDFLSWELLAMKKYAHFAAECQDAQLQQLILQAGRKHRQHYELILSNLQ